MTRIVASLIERDASGISESSKRAYASGADIVELRLDHLKDLNEGSVLAARQAALGPAIATLRSKHEGGLSKLEGPARGHILRSVIDSDFEYVDLEVRADSGLLKSIRKDELRPVTIASHHFPRPVTRRTVEKAVQIACSMGDIGKVAMPCEHAGHAMDLVQVALNLSKTKKRYIIIGMGRQGSITRICADKLGSELVYACMPGREAASGQLSVESQRAPMDRERILVGLLGHPVSHSVSKPMQEAAMSEAGMIGTYLPLDFPPKELSRRTLHLLKELGFAGINVTIPHKRWAFETCTKKGIAAAATKAVNTIILTRGNIVGENTDVIGFSKLIEGKTSLSEDTRCLVIGAGGAARAVAYHLSKNRVRFAVTDKDMARARALAREFDCRPVTAKELWENDEDFLLVVNCSPVGMKGVSADSPVKDFVFKPGAVFIDIIFNPPKTTAMALAEAKGARAFGGLEMLVQQGAESFRLWTGREPNVDAMREAARRALE
jgi:shikimate dehydrogenase/3-dehydroquinate dehydratase type I